MKELASGAAARESGKEVGAAMPRVLLIESDRRIRDLLLRGLGAQGFTVTVAPSGTAAVEFLHARALDLVLLDLVTRDLDGLALLGAIRARRPRLPVIAFIACDDERLQVEALDSGADDCVTIPFSLAELAARMRARLRRREESGALVEAGPLALDLVNRRASLGHHSVLLTAREASLLAAFIRCAGQVLSRDQLRRLAWEIEFDPGSNVVDVYVAALRRKLRADLIETVRGFGYRLRVGLRDAETATGGGASAPPPVRGRAACYRRAGVAASSDSAETSRRMNSS